MTVSSNLTNHNLLQIGSKGTNAGRKKTYDEIMSDKRLSKNDDMEQFNQKLDDQIKIMCALLKNQMPDKESDPEKMMQPIFQIMSTEQLVQMNRNMTQMRQTHEKTSKMEVTSLLGQDVEVKTKNFTFKNEPLEFAYTLPEYINNPKCEIYTDHNPKNPVHSIELDPNELSGQIRWTGHLPNGEMAREGAYKIRVVGDSKTEKMTDGKSKYIEAETTLFTHVDAVHLAKNKGSAELVSGKMIFSSSDIQSVRRPERLQNAYFQNDQLKQAVNINEQV